MSERLERVTALRQLGTGMKVAIMPCGWCGARHDTMLLNPIHGMLIEADGSPVGLASGFEAAHRRACLPAIYPADSVNESVIARGCVFRVLDGLEEPSTETAAASPTKQRTKETAS